MKSGKKKDTYNPYRLDKNDGKLPKRYRKPKGKRKNGLHTQ